MNILLQNQINLILHLKRLLVNSSIALKYIIVFYTFIYNTFMYISVRTKNLQIETKIYI